MACQNCEEIPGDLPSACSVFVWPPLGHTEGKFRDWKTPTGSRGVWRERERCLALDVPDGQLGKALVEMAGFLSEQELADCRVLVVPSGHEPGFADFPRVESLHRLIAKQQSGWLLDMLREKRMFSVYQPIFAAGQPATPFAFEALTRGAEPDGTVIPAGHMIGAARDAGIAFQLDLQARINAVSQFRPPSSETRLFINFSPTSIYDPAYCLRSTIARIDERGIDRKRIVFEVIESEQHTNLTHLRGILAHYRRNGFQVALDDFGAGYNGINVLEALQPDFVKFDMQLIRGVDQDVRKQMILETLTTLCRQLGAKTLAEGIETDGELATVNAIGIDYLQGYLLGRPARM